MEEYLGSVMVEAWGTVVESVLVEESVLVMDLRGIGKRPLPHILGMGCFQGKTGVLQHVDYNKGLHDMDSNQQQSQV